MYTFEDLKQDVAKEAEALKMHATKEELGRLDIATLNSRNYSLCIYGQITQNCFSQRASNLIFNCCKRYFKAEIEKGGEAYPIEYASSIDGDVCQFVNGQNIDGVFTDDQLHNIRETSGTLHYSSIEAYLMLPSAKNANLIAFLKGETETLEL